MAWQETYHASGGRRIVVRHGIEGPRSDPYETEQYEVWQGARMVAMLHLGLATWGQPTAERELVVAFEAALLAAGVPYTYAGIRAAIRLAERRTEREADRHAAMTEREAWDPNP